ncbi:hypothetical protein RA280_47580, partial [Cupriavidus sp. CV2]|uniref:hypothetical protein n=1 Tax=Cupriavidus ulmosensis TaxID=3065913 RepID=UPI00296B2918
MIETIFTADRWHRSSNAIKLSTKSESVVCPESLKDYIDISFKGFGVAGLEGQPLVFHLVP